MVIVIVIASHDDQGTIVITAYMITGMLTFNDEKG